MSKKIMRILASILICTLIFQPMCIQAKGKDASTKANDSYASATYIGVNSTYIDYISSYNDVNWYRFNISSAGYISLKFIHDYVESSRSHWRATLYNSSQSELVSYSYAGNETENQGANIGLGAGTYYLKITSGDWDSDTNYKIRVNHTSSSMWETEFNDSYTTADNVTVNTTYNGSIMHSSGARI